MTKPYQNGPTFRMLSTDLALRPSYSVNQTSSAQVHTRSIGPMLVVMMGDGANQGAGRVGVGAPAACLDVCTAEPDVVGSLRSSARGGA